MRFLHNLFASRRKINARAPFGLAVVGLGHGAEKMCAAVADSPSVRVTALVSSSRAKAELFRKHHARMLGDVKLYTYDTFDELAKNDLVDGVYLSLPVALHRPFTERAAAAGKHVLSEKPMASSVADAQAMVEACRAAGTQLMIAYRLDYDPMHAEAKQLLAEGALGELRSVYGAFGIHAKTGWRFDPAMAGGGSLFDVGVYPIHALHHFFGEVNVRDAQIVYDRATGMELDAVWSGTLSQGATFRCESSYLRRIHDELRLEGTRGTLVLRHAFAYERTILRAEFSDDGARKRHFAERDPRRNASLFRLEAEHLAAAAAGTAKMQSPGETGVRDLETIATIERIATRTAR